MKFLVNYSEDDVLAKVLLVYFAFQHSAIGLFLLFGDMSQIKSKTLNEMATILPMDAWGLILIFAACNFILAAVQVSKLSFLAMIVAGITGAVVFSLLSMASLELSTNQTNTINYMIVASIDILIAIVGGVALWLRRTL